MRSVKSKGNKSTETVLRMFLIHKGVSGWKMHPKDIPGKPDFWFPNKHLAIFVDGCFWHGYFCITHIPYKNPDYWKKKIERNVARDKEVTNQLKGMKIRALRVWEHELRDKVELERKTKTLFAS